jgi:hypothetical protein
MNFQPRHLLFLVAFAAASRVFAADQSVQLSPVSLDGWTLNGADNTALATAQSLNLPAGSQVSRSFKTNELAVNLVVQPRFAENPTECPAIEIGSAALLFVQTGDQEGHIKLVLGDNAPIVLPFSVALDGEGRSIDPLEITFAAGPDYTAVVAFGQTLIYPAVPAGQAFEVAVSAGNIGSLLISQFEVVFATGDEKPGTTANNSSIGKTLGGGKSVNAGNHFGAVSNPSASDTTASGSLVTDASSTAPKVIHTEIITPSSMRPHGRIEVVRRAALTTNTQK